MRRRQFLAGALVATLPSAVAQAASHELLPFTTIEQRTGGRLGVAVIDTATSRMMGYRSGERFAMCSTFKCMLVATVLARIDHGLEHASRPIAYGPADLLEYAPVTRAYVGHGSMTVAALCEAAVTLSDNAAANLLLQSVGGPAAVTSFARHLGDTVTRLDRREPFLNTAIPGDARDTTSPLAMAKLLRAVTLGDALAPPSRARLVTWLRACRTGDRRVRAGVPGTWTVGDKTGTGGPLNALGANGTRNDIAIVWPPHRAPLIICVYLTGATVTAAIADRAIADCAHAVVTATS